MLQRRACTMTIILATIVWSEITHVLLGVGIVHAASIMAQRHRHVTARCFESNGFFRKGAFLLPSFLSPLLLFSPLLPSLHPASLHLQNLLHRPIDRHRHRNQCMICYSAREILLHGSQRDNVKITESSGY